jgi:hypothetical protein
MHRLGFGMAGIAAGTIFGHFLCFVLMNMVAARSFGGRRYAAGFLVDLFVPIAVGAPLLFAMSKVAETAGNRGARGFLIAAACTAVFCVLYSPVLVWLDRKTAIRKSVLAPLLDRIRQRRSRSGS